MTEKKLVEAREGMTILEAGQVIMAVGQASDLSQKYLQKHGKMPEAGESKLDDLF